MSSPGMGMYVYQDRRRARSFRGPRFENEEYVNFWTRELAEAQQMKLDAQATMAAGAQSQDVKAIAEGERLLRLARVMKREAETALAEYGRYVARRAGQ